jgi:hypothetical protein
MHYKSWTVVQAQVATRPLTADVPVPFSLIKTSFAALAALSVLACAGGDTQSADAPAVAPNVVTFTAVDFGFEGPSEIAAGPTTFRMISSGKEIHHLTLVKLEEGKTYDSLLAAMKNPGPPPPWMVFVGGPNAPAPGTESNATLTLDPGNYALLCFVDTPDKIPHMMKGMTRPLTVTPATTPVASTLPPPTLTVTMNEYSFTLDKPLSVGKHTIKVVNAGKEPHEFSILRMDPGKTLEDLGAWMETMQGPPPGAPLGGIAPTVNGNDGQFDIDLAPGNYLLVCFLPAPDGKLHFMHGMQQQIQLQ